MGKVFLLTKERILSSLVKFAFNSYVLCLRLQHLQVNMLCTKTIFEADTVVVMS